MIFNKGPMTIQWGKTIFSTNGSWKTGHPHVKKVKLKKKKKKLYPSLHYSYTKTNSKWIKDLNVS